MKLKMSFLAHNLKAPLPPSSTGNFAQIEGFHIPLNSTEQTLDAQMVHMESECKFLNQEIWF